MSPSPIYSLFCCIVLSIFNIEGQKGKKKGVDLFMKLWHLNSLPSVFAFLEIESRELTKTKSEPCLYITRLESSDVSVCEVKVSVM